MLNHYEQAVNLHQQLKIALDAIYKTGQMLPLMQLCDSLKASAKYMQWQTDENYQSLEMACGQPEVIKSFGYRNPCQDFEWVKFN